MTPEQREACDRYKQARYKVQDTKLSAAYFDGETDKLGNPIDLDPEDGHVRVDRRFEEGGIAIKGEAHFNIAPNYTIDMKSMDMQSENSFTGECERVKFESDTAFDENGDGTKEARGKWAEINYGFTTTQYFVNKNTQVITLIEEY